MTSFARNCLALLALGLLLSTPAVAQELAADDGPEIVRDARALVDVIRPHPQPDPDSTDTVLVFTSKSNQGGKALCKAFNQNGRAVGRAWLRVPGLGLRFATASDIAGDLDFVGSIQCFATTNLIGSAVLLAGGEVSDLPVENGRLSAANGRRVLFPVVATY